MLRQAFRARRMGNTTLIAETGTGEHGIATSTVATRLGVGRTVYMNEGGTCGQALNVFGVRIVSCSGVPVAGGKSTLKDPLTEGLRQWVTSVDTAHHIVGSVIVPHYDQLTVREFQRVSDEKARSRCVSCRPELRADESVEYRDIPERKGSTHTCSPAPQLAPTDWCLSAAIPTDSSGQSVSWAPPVAHLPMRTCGLSSSGPGHSPTPRCSSVSESTRRTSPRIAAQVDRHADGVIVACALMRHVVEGRIPGEIARTLGTTHAPLFLAAA
ncbi:MAG: hypothetical protein ACYDC0_14580 [Acidimicrobiales bacterium]